MESQDDFNRAWVLMRSNEEFMELCLNERFEAVEQKYIVCTGMNHNIPDTDKCKLIDLKYNHAAHRRYKVNRERGEYDAGIFLTVKCLTGDKQRSNSTKLTDIERLEEIIEGDHRITDRLKAMELKEKLVEKRQGTHKLAPWMNIWNDVIIPNMIQAH